MLQKILEELGLHVWFRYEKYREEFSADDVVIAVDETPVGMFVEIEGGEDAIHETARGARQAPPPTTSPTRTASSSCSIATRTAWRDTTWCSPACPPSASAKVGRAGECHWRLAGAGPDRRPGHPPAAAVVGARQGGAAGGRRRRWCSRILRWLRDAGVAPRRPQSSSSRRHHHAHRRRRFAPSASTCATRGRPTCWDRPAARRAPCRCSPPIAS